VAGGGGGGGGGGGHLLMVDYSVRCNEYGVTKVRSGWIWYSYHSKALGGVVRAADFVMRVG
jgi:hypothetical protein